MLANRSISFSRKSPPQISEQNSRQTHIFEDINGKNTYVFKPTASKLPENSSQISRAFKLFSDSKESEKPLPPAKNIRDRVIVRAVRRLSKAPKNNSNQLQFESNPLFSRPSQFDVTEDDIADELAEIEKSFNGANFNIAEKPRPTSTTPFERDFAFEEEIESVVAEHL